MNGVYDESLHAFVKYETLGELRKKSKLNKELHDMYNSYLDASNADKWPSQQQLSKDNEVEQAINLAYRLCARLCEDDNEETDAWEYSKKAINDYVSNKLVLAFMRFLVDGFVAYSPYYKYCPNQDGMRQFLKDVDRYIDDYYVKQAIPYDITQYKEYFEQLDLRVKPIPPSQIFTEQDLIISPFTGTSERDAMLKKITHDFEQEDIRKTVFRYETQTDRLEMLKMIQGAFIYEPPF